MAADPQEPARSLLDRWRALAPGGVAPRAVEPPPRTAEPAPAPLDPAALVAELTDDLTRSAPVALPFLAPIREASALPADARDPVAIAIAIAQLEDVLEALLLSPAPASAEG